MNSLYLWIDLLSISVPLLVSFHPRLQLHKRFPALGAAIVLSLVPYVIWDVVFTVNGVWGFNDDYLIGLRIFHLPLEEWLFFICIPYACVFTHYAILELKPDWRLPENLTRNISRVLLLLFLTGSILFWDKAYTRVDLLFAAGILAWAYFKRIPLLRGYLVTFLFMLVPFFIVNGVLTGTGIEGNIVWYNDEENLGIRLGTIPVEDSVYAFSLILLNLLLFESFQKELTT